MDQLIKYKNFLRGKNVVHSEKLSEQGHNLFKIALDIQIHIEFTYFLGCLW